MRTLTIICLALLGLGCSSRSALDQYMDSAYQAYALDDCDQTLLALSQAERVSRRRHDVQPEISLLRGHCLERQRLFVDAAQTYEFIQAYYPESEYAYRARARLETLRLLGHYKGAAVVSVPGPAPVTAPKPAAPVRHP